MKPLWKPAIDQWIPESQDISNMTSRGISYQYMPPVTDMYAGNEGEEGEVKINVPGQGRVALDEVKKRISDYFKDCDNLISSDNVKDLEKLEYLMNNPEISNLIKIVSNHLKTLKSKVS
jgi:hypothetical protein